jgi:hypothetical protein
VARENGKKEELKVMGSAGVTLTSFIVTVPPLTLTRLIPTVVPDDNVKMHVFNSSDVPADPTRDVTPPPTVPSKLNVILSKDNSPPS